MRHIIVDGYNVIRADPRLQTHERDSLQRARTVLAQMLAGAPRLANDQVTLVFDGWNGVRGHVHRGRLGRITLLYSARGQRADDVIVDQAAALAARGRVIVVTNDRDVQERCRALGCEVSGAENLLRQVPGRPRHASSLDGDEPATRLSTVKRGNPRRSPRRARRQREVRF